MPSRHHFSSRRSATNQTRRQFRLIGVGVLVTTVAALAWPAPPPRVADAPSGGKPFVWGRDSVWRALESSFAESRAKGCTSEGAARATTDSIDRRLATLRAERIPA